MRLVRPQSSPLLSRINARRGYVNNQLERFDIDATTNCWNWNGPMQCGSAGEAYSYGRMSISINGDKRRFAAHRVAYAAHNNSDPVDLFVCHRCDNPKCINPAHLFLGTALDNTADMIIKGRAADMAGEKNGNSKLSRNSAILVMRLIEDGGTNKSIAEITGVSHSMVSLIRRGKAWQVAANDIGFEPMPIFKRSKANK